MRWSEFSGTGSVEEIREELKQSEEKRNQLGKILMKVLKRDGLDISQVSAAEGLDL